MAQPPAAFQRDAEKRFLIIFLSSFLLGPPGQATKSNFLSSHKDHQAISHILDLDPNGLYDTVLGQRISMCGIMPTTITMIAALELGATRAELVRYSDSGEASGDTNQVVGYAGITIHG